METTFSLRQLQPEDGDAYAALMAESPDTGSVGVKLHFEIDPYQALLGFHRELVGFVVETPGVKGIVGGGLIWLGECQWEGKLRRSAVLNSLAVLPAFRGRGVANRVNQGRVAYARGQIGEDGVIWANIQDNNVASVRAAKHWAKEFLTNRLVLIPMKMRSIPPASHAPYRIRPMRPDDAEYVVEQLNRFYRDYNLWSPLNAEGLVTWLNDTPVEKPIRHFYLVTDEAGRLLAGLSLAENYRLRTDVVTKMPLVLRWLNALLQVVPPDGVIREVELSRVWYLPGQEGAVRCLIETLRWEWRDRATTMMCYVDVLSPLMDVYGVRPWTVKTHASFAVNAPVPCSEGRLCCYMY